MNRLFFASINLIFLATIVGCCTTNTSSPPDKFSKYPLEHRGGKSFRLIPASEFLLAEEHPVPPAPSPQGESIVVSLSCHRAWHFTDGLLDNVSAVCTGKPGHETKTGRFHVVSKHRDWTSTIYHVPMPFFLRLDPGDFGLHQGIVALSTASHGCIRLPEGKALEFFESTKTGSVVLIVE